MSLRMSAGAESAATSAMGGGAPPARSAAGATELPSWGALAAATSRPQPRGKGGSRAGMTARITFHRDADGRLRATLDGDTESECVDWGSCVMEEIDGSALALMAPLLKRGFDEPTTSIKRNAARIVENMAKLVDDPYEVEPFVPQLLPQLERAKEAGVGARCGVAVATAALATAAVATAAVATAAAALARFGRAIEEAWLP